MTLPAGAGGFCEFWWEDGPGLAWVVSVQKRARGWAWAVARVEPHVVAEEVLREGVAPAWEVAFMNALAALAEARGERGS